MIQFVELVEGVFQLPDMRFAKQRLVLPDVVLTFPFRHVGRSALLCWQLGEFSKLLPDLLFNAKVDAALLTIGLRQFHCLHEVETVRCTAQYMCALGCGPLQFGIRNMQCAVAGECQGVFAYCGLPDILSDFSVLPEQFGRHSVFKAILMQVATVFINHIQIAVTHKTQADRSFQVFIARCIRQVVKPFHTAVSQW
ncbi:hypothetical protein ALP64_201840 [Pseudomonas syringae pv. actinidiae]|nr:hypothetical protein ALP64_201840 [Pseudomonas syringae pv. actinidiae]